MTIQYALTRREVVSSFYQSALESSKYGMTILSYYVVMGLILALGGWFGHAGAKSIAIRFLVGIAIFAVLQLTLLFFSAKTATRSLTISRDGVSTYIGRLTGNLRWDQIGTIEERPKLILLARKSGNAFYIPNRAFADSAEKVEFVRLAKQWAMSNVA